MKLKSIKDILNMLDLFYANKHLHDKIKAHRQKYAPVANR